MFYFFKIYLVFLIIKVYNCYVFLWIIYDEMFCLVVFLVCSFFMRCYLGWWFFFKNNFYYIKDKVLIRIVYLIYVSIFYCLKLNNNFSSF